MSKRYKPEIDHIEEPQVSTLNYKCGYCNTFFVSKNKRNIHESKHSSVIKNILTEKDWNVIVMALMSKIGESKEKRDWDGIDKMHAYERGMRITLRKVVRNYVTDSNSILNINRKMLIIPNVFPNRKLTKTDNATEESIRVS